MLYGYTRSMVIRPLMLLLFTASLCGCSSPDETQLLFSAIKAQDEQEVDRLIQRGHFDIDPPPVPNEVNKPLSYAAAYGTVNIVKSLIAAGGDINGRTAYGDVPLIDALERGRTDMTVFLIEQGADVNRPNDFGVTPFIGICAHENLDLVRLAHQHGGEIDTTYSNRISQTPGTRNLSALHAAVDHGNAPAVRYLLEQGGDPSLQTTWGKDCFDLESENGDQAILDLLEPYVPSPAQP